MEKGAFVKTFLSVCICEGSSIGLQDALLKPLRSKFPGLPDYKLREALQTTKNRSRTHVWGVRIGIVRE